jgi:hypothetical protein
MANFTSLLGIHKNLSPRWINPIQIINKNVFVSIPSSNLFVLVQNGQFHFGFQTEIIYSLVCHGFSMSAWITSSWLQVPHRHQIDCLSSLGTDSTENNSDQFSYLTDRIENAASQLIYCCLFRNCCLEPSLFAESFLILRPLLSNGSTCHNITVDSVILTVACNTKNHWDFELCPSSGIANNQRIQLEYNWFWRWSITLTLGFWALVQWLKLALPKGPNKVGGSLLWLEDEKRSGFQNIFSF